MPAPLNPKQKLLREIIARAHPRYCSIVIHQASIYLIGGHDPDRVGARYTKLCPTLDNAKLRARHLDGVVRWSNPRPGIFVDADSLVTTSLANLDLKSRNPTADCALFELYGGRWTRPRLV